ncbi:MAG: hypothetical protein U1E62_24435 [Alsobacter sp.]
MRLPIALALAGVASLAFASSATAQQIQAGADPRCADYGSFAVVDPPAPPRGAPVVARSWHPCAELPGSPQQPPLYIDAQVQIGGQGTTSGTGAAGTGAAVGTGGGIAAGGGGPGVSIGVGGIAGAAGGWQPSMPLAPPGGLNARGWRR